ncbi:MAG: EAL domain-containing protein [Thiotrichales bacterium]|nr:EAL domain-containing protein [Thiotrichales bacterium]
MSLTKQMILFISAMLMILLLGTFGLNLSNTKTFLQNQLQTHAQDTATSLGLSLSSVADPEDPSSMETMINAVFDRGYYSYIELIDVEDQRLYFRQNPQSIEGIPQWFIRLISFKAPTAEALVQTGWNPIGTLSVQSHPGYAYIELWKAANNLFIWFTVAALIAMTLAYIAIQAMLKPLKSMEKQAEAIVKKEYLLQDKLPSTIEFKQVVIAINAMVSKMKEVFERDANIAQKLQKMAYQDSVTGMSNRVHFEMNIDALLDPQQETCSGALCLVRIEGLKALNDQYGYLIGDKMMKLLSTSLKENCTSSKALYARLNGTELIAVLPDESAEALLVNAEQLAQHYPAILQELNAQIPEVFISVALMNYHLGDRRAALLAQLDFAVQQAVLKGQNQAYCLAKENNQTSASDNWEHLLTQAIENHRFMLFQQPSFDADGNIHDRELLIRLKDEDGTMRSAGYFMPAVEKLNKVFEIDSLVIQMALAYINTQAPKETLAINLSQAVLNSKLAMNTIVSALRTIKTQALAFELSETLVTSEKDSAWPFMQALKAQNIEIGIDHFGGRFADMRYLQDLRPDYIKLDAALSKAIEKDEQTQSYVSSLCEMAKSLDIQVIAMAVENDAQVAAFKSLGVNYFQGYHFGAPTALS